MQKEKVHIISHTHWDAEWYFTYKDTNVLLVKNMRDAILKSKKTRYPFHWDGQVYPAKTYYQLEQNSDFINAIKNQQILIGPWFTQSNARQINEETYFRNLEHGIYEAKKLGHVTRHGMMSDIFGFADQVPQILKKHNINDFIFMRGWDRSLTNNVNEFYWVAPSGHKVFSKNLHLGYGNAKFLDEDESQIKNQYLKIKNEDIALSPSRHSLLYHGGDQMFMRDNIEQIGHIANKIDTKSNWVPSSLENYINDVKKAIKESHISLPIFKGELIKTTHHRIHISAYSQRQDINELISTLEYKIVNTAEPLNVMADENGLGNYASIIYEAWEALFLSTAHDAAVGCNSDATNRAIKQRLIEAHQSIDSLLNLIKRSFIDLHAIKENEVIVFNTNFKKEAISLDYKITSPFADLEIIGKNLSYIVTNSVKRSGGEKVVVNDGGEQTIALPPYYLHDVKLYLKDVEPLAFIKLHIAKAKSQPPNQEVVNLKEDFLNGNQLNLCYEANDGDGYDFSPIEKLAGLNKKIALENIKFKVHQDIKYTCLKLSHDVYDDFLTQKNKIKQTYELAITIWPSNQIDFQFTTINQIKNVRVSLKLSQKNIIKSVEAKTIFYLKKYHNQLIPKNWAATSKEFPANIFPFIGYLKLEQGYLMSKALREFYFSNHELFVTAFRTNGFLGKNNLAWRPGRASGVNDIKVATPDAQLINTKIKFDISFAKNSTAFKNYMTEIGAYQKQSLAKHIERLQRFNFAPQAGTMHDLIFNVTHVEVIAVYINEVGKLKARLLNRTNQKVVATILCKRQEIKKEFKPWEIITISL